MRAWHGHHGHHRSCPRTTTPRAVGVGDEGRFVLSAQAGRRFCTRTVRRWSRAQPLAGRQALPSAISLTTLLTASNCDRWISPLRWTIIRCRRRSMQPPARSDRDSSRRCVTPPQLRGPELARFQQSQSVASVFSPLNAGGLSQELSHTGFRL